MAKKPKESKEQRNARGRAQYRQLLDAGFSSKEAARYRFSTPEKVAAAIEAQQLPQIEQKKRGRKSKIEAHVVQYPYIRQQVIELNYLNDSYLEKVVKYMKASEPQGYNFYSITIIFTAPTGKTSSFSSPMAAVGDLTDLGHEIATLIEVFMNKYKETEEDPLVDVEINLWDYSHPMQKAG